MERTLGHMMDKADGRQRWPQGRVQYSLWPLQSAKYSQQSQKSLAIFTLVVMMGLSTPECSIVSEYYPVVQSRAVVCRACMKAGRHNSETFDSVNNIRRYTNSYLHCLNLETCCRRAGVDPGPVPFWLQHNSVRNDVGLGCGECAARWRDGWGLSSIAT